MTEAPLPAVVERPCQRCGTTFTEKEQRRGRPRRWCKRACRDKVYRDRKGSGLTGPR